MPRCGHIMAGGVEGPADQLRVIPQAILGT